MTILASKDSAKLILTKAIFISVLFFTFSCASNPTPSTTANTGTDPLDAAIRATSDYLNTRLKKGIKIVFLNFQSESTSLSEYIIDGLIENTVNDEMFTVVDRQNLDIIRKEVNFQYSGEVSDESAQAIGKMLGAQIIVSGAISPLGNLYRLRVRAISVETAEIQGQINRDIESSPRIMALLKNSGTSVQSGYSTGNVGNNQSVAIGTTGNTGNGTTTTSTVTTDSSKNTTITDAVPGAIMVNSSSAWNSAVNKIRTGGDNQTYIIIVSGNISVPGINENLFGDVKGLSVTIQGGGTLSLSNKGRLLQIGPSQTVILKNIILSGRSNNDFPVVYISGKDSLLRMEDNSSIIGNSNDVYYLSRLEGGGVHIGANGTFIMDSGTISGNTAKHSSGGASPTNGGGVYVGRNGTFTMQGGVISDNTATGSGGGVYITGGTFTKTGGTIQNNKAGKNNAYNGAAVYRDNGQRWRNATAGPDDNTTGGYGFWLND